MTKRILTQAELKEQLHYNPDTGIFTWLVSKRGLKMGTVASNFDKTTGYIRIMINGKQHYAHRLAFLYMEGELPPEVTDHANGIKNDNRWLNLRRASHAENHRNTGKQANNTSGYRGVSFCKSRGNYEAYCTTAGKTVKLGYHITAELAFEARASFAKLHHGNFYRE